MMFFFFFFKQKTAYEIYQCDWSSDVCSSDLISATRTRSRCIHDNGLIEDLITQHLVQIPLRDEINRAPQCLRKLIVELFDRPTEIAVV